MCHTHMILLLLSKFRYLYKDLNLKILLLLFNNPYAIENFACMLLMLKTESRRKTYVNLLLTILKWKKKRKNIYS